MNYEQLSSVIMDESEDIIYLADPHTYELVYLNKSAIKRLGERTERYRGKKCYEVLQGLDKPCPFCNNDILTKDKFVKWRHHNELYDLYASIKDKLVEIDGKDYRLEIASDITEMENARRQLQQQLNLQKTMLKCVETLNIEEDIDEAINRLLSIIGTFYRADRAYIFEFVDGGKLLDNTYEWCKKGVVPQIDNLQQVPSSSVDRWMVEFERVGEFYITSMGKEVSKDSIEYEVLEPQGIESLMAAPMRHNDKIIGFIGVDNPSVNLNMVELLKTMSLFIINDLKKAEMNRKMYELSYKDMLTGIGNRNMYISVMDNFEENPPEALGVVFVDINGLKIANDKFGHDYGDRMIKSVAEGMYNIFGEETYRIGGDEFVAFMVDCTKEEFEDKVLALRGYEQEESFCAFSIGADFCVGNVNILQQLEHSDSMMYSEKQRYYSKKNNDRRSRDHYLAKELHDDIAAGRFKVLLQPKIDLRTEKVVGAEALVRKVDSEGNVVPPTRFIPLLESEGIVGQVDMFVLDSVCKTLKEWQDKGHELINVSVNFSRITLAEIEIVERTKELVESYGISPENITIEITETVSKISEDYLKKLIDALQEVGFNIALDDFGSKYSNLSILTNIDFHELKMDKSLIDDITTNPKTQIVVLHGINICKDLDNTTSLAEGIELKEQLNMLKKLGCDEGQGYFFSKPIPIEEFYAKYIDGE